MRLKKLTLILSSTIALVACNGGSGNQGETTAPQKNDSQEMVPNPRIVRHHTKQNNLKSLGSTSFEKSLKDVLATNEGVEIGYGYDPTTGSVLRTEFDLKNFYYMSGDKQLSGFADTVNKTGINCTSGAYGKEIGAAAHYSSADLIKADLSGSGGIGLSKVSLALSYQYEANYASTGMHFDTVYGAEQSCNLDTFVSPKIKFNEDLYKKTGEAIRMAAKDIDYALQQIESTTNRFDRQKLIKKFYTTYGTYMVSGVTLGAVAMKNIHLEEKKVDTSSNQRYAGQASYSSPFSEVSGSGEYQQARKFNGADWLYSIAQASYPDGENTNNLAQTIKSIQDELERMKSNGIIDTNKFKDPDTSQINNALEKPKLPEFNNDKVAADKIAARSALDKLNEILKGINPDLTGEKDVKKIRYENNAKEISEALSTLSVLKGPSTSTGGSLYLFLDDEEKIDLIQNITPKLSEWKRNSLATLYTNAVEAIADSEKLEKIEKKIKQIIKSADSAASDVKKDKEQEDTSAEEKRNKQGVTWSQFLLKKMEENSPEEYRNYLNHKDTPTTADLLFSKWQLDHAKELKIWKKEFGGGNQVKVPLMVPAADAQNFKVKSLRSDDSKTLYDGFGILDYSITPWVKIFPVLSPDFSIDDSKEVGKGLITNNINMNYEQEFNYLEFVQKIDGSLSGLYQQAKKEDKILQKLKLDLSQAITSDDDNPKITFNGKTYEIDNTDGGYIDLNQSVTDYIQNSILVKSQWYKVTKILFDKGLIGQHGSFAGLQPVQPASEASNEYSIISQNGTISNNDGDIADKSMFDNTTQDFLHQFESSATMDAAPADSYYNYSPMRLWLSIISNSLKLGENSDLPRRGILEGDRGVLLPSDSTMKNNYMTSIYNPASRIALKYVPANNKPTQMLGIVPVVLLKTAISGEVIRGLGVIDSKGRIWGLKPGIAADKGDAFTAETLTYTLDLSKTIGTNPNSPAYPLTLENGDGLVSEIRSKVIKDNNSTYSYNRYIIGTSFMPDIIKIENAYNGHHGLIANGGAVKLLTGIGYVDIVDATEKYKKGFTEDIFRSAYTNDYSKVLPQFSRATSNIIPPNGGRLSSIQTNGPLLDMLLKHQLVITPITDDNIQDMNNVLKNNNTKQPLLPTYPF